MLISTFKDKVLCWQLYVLLFTLYFTKTVIKSFTKPEVTQFE